MILIFYTVLTLSLLGTSWFLFLKIIKLLFKKYVLKRWIYYSSILGVFFFIIPFWKLELPSFLLQSQPLAALENISMPFKISLTDDSFLSAQQDWTWYIAWSWAIIAIILIFVYVFQYKQFLKKILQNSVTDNRMETAELLKDLKKAMGMKHHVEIFICDYISTPILVGLFRNYIFLPKVNAVEQNRYILLHELHHLKHADNWIKGVFQIVKCIHWFNPIIYYIVKALEDECELACDEAVVSGFKVDEKKQYGFTILNLLLFRSHKSEMQSISYMCNDDLKLKSRLYEMMEAKDSIRRIICSGVFAFIVFCMLDVFILFSINEHKSTSLISSVDRSMWVTEPIRHLIGKEEKVSGDPRKFGVGSYKLEDSVVAFELNGTNGVYKIKDLMLINGSPVILQSKINEDMYLRKGDVVSFEFENYPSEVINPQGLMIGMAKEGAVEEQLQYKTLKGSYEVEIKSDGYYGLYLLSLSSDSLTIRSGTIKINVCK